MNLDDLRQMPTSAKDPQCSAQRAAEHLQSIILPVHLAADDAEQRFAFDEYRNAILLHLFIELARLFWRHVFEVITHSSAAFIAHANANQLRASWCL